MKTAAKILMRTLNVIVVTAFLWLLFRTVLMFTGVSDWFVFIAVTVIPFLCVLVGVGVISYILFGKFKVWHKPADHTQVGDN
jgi:hypothetical protein